jgi:hypothetical protein
MIEPRGCPTPGACSALAEIDALTARLAEAEAQRDANYLECAREFRRAAEATAAETIGRYKHEARALAARLAEAEAQRDEARRTDLAEYVYNTTPQAALREAHRQRRYWEGQYDKATASRDMTTENLAAAIAAAIVAHSFPALCGDRAHSFDALSGDRARLEAVIAEVMRNAGH